MDGLLEKLYSLLYTDLILNSPVLSGNMQSMIQLGQVGVYNADIVIEAPFYDMNEWNKNKKVIHTGENRDGFTDYAYWVNESGGFGSHNKSEHWVNNVCYDVASAIANEIGGEVINELPL